jgi:hypothetical protein
MTWLIDMRLYHTLRAYFAYVLGQLLGISLNFVFLKLVGINYGLGSPQADLISRMLMVQFSRLSALESPSQPVSGSTYFVKLKLGAVLFDEALCVMTGVIELSNLHRGLAISADSRHPFDQVGMSRQAPNCLRGAVSIC